MLSGALRNRSVRFAAGLAVAIAIPIAALLYLQFRSVIDLENTWEYELRQSSRTAAADLADKIYDALLLPDLAVFLRLNQSDLEPLNLDYIHEAVAAACRQSGFIDAFYGGGGEPSARHLVGVVRPPRPPRAGARG
jgi:hypothetical protein